MDEKLVNDVLVYEKAFRKMQIRTNISIHLSKDPRITEINKISKELEEYVNYQSGKILPAVDDAVVSIMLRPTIYLSDAEYGMIKRILSSLRNVAYAGRQVSMLQGLIDSARIQ